MPAFFRELSTYCDEAGCRKVLLLGSKTTVNLSVVDLYELGTKIAGLRLQIAIVESHDASDDDESFFEAVALNRGGPIQFFNTEEEAQHWLDSF